MRIGRSGRSVPSGSRWAARQVWISRATHRDIADEVTERLVEQTKAQKVGDPRDRATDVGPMISEAAADRVEQWVGAALDGGARRPIGGRREGKLVWPTVLANSTVTASCVKDAGAPASTAISVSPASRSTDSNGRADFTISTSGLRLIADSGNAPSGRCTFRAHASSANIAVVEVLGQRIAPTLNVNPSSENVPTLVRSSRSTVTI